MEVIGNKCVVYEFGKFVLDPKERTLLADGLPLHLPAKEFDTLVLLVEHNGRALTKEEMMSTIWRDSFVEEGNLAKQISRLRKIFNTNGDQFIETLPKHGYRFNADLHRTVRETNDGVILERRTVKRVRVSFDDAAEVMPVAPVALLPGKRSIVTLPRVGLGLLIVILGIGFLTWYRGRNRAPVVDPYAPVRLTDNPNDDTWPSWTRDGRIRFARIFTDNRSELWTMQPDGSEQTMVKMPPGKRIFSWSPNEQKIQFQKVGDETKSYIANADGSGEKLLPFSSGSWSADSKMLAYHQKVSGDNRDIFIYSVETGEIRNITNNESFDADPSFSPDGKKVVFVSYRDGNPELYSINIDGTDVRRLTYNPALDAHPSYSPDGTQIAFGSVREKENGDIYLMNADGSGVVKLFGWDKTNETVEPGGWSPDGTKIAFYTDRNGKDDIYVVSAETVRPTLLLSDPEHNLGTPSISPDGKSIAYSQESEDRSGELRTLNLESGRTSIVRKTELPIVSADWSPDGQSIAFSDRPNGNSEVFLIKPDGSELQNLTNDPSSDTGPTWSPDGRHLVFVSTRGEPSGSQLYVMNADGSDPHPLTPRKGWEGDAVWTPDGNEVVFTCDRVDSPGNMLDICQIDADGSGEKRILFHRDHDTHPAVSPDGTRIAFTSRSDGNLEIYLMNRDGSGLRRLTRDPADDEGPDWSPDGQSIVFISNRGGKFAIYEIKL